MRENFYDFKYYVKSGSKFINEKQEPFNETINICLKFNKNTVESFLSKGLLFFVKANDVDGVKFLLELGADPKDPHWKRENRENIIIIAAAKEEREIIDLLLNYGADINFSDEYGSINPLNHIIAIDLPVDFIKFILDKGSNVNINIDSKFLDTPLEMILRFQDRLIYKINYIEIFEILIKLGALARRNHIKNIFPELMNLISNNIIE